MPALHQHGDNASAWVGSMVCDRCVIAHLHFSLRESRSDVMGKR